MRLRVARLDEFQWINDRYAEVRFQPSDLAEEIVVIASIDERPAGLGRLVPIDEDAWELGGILVFEEFRGRGVARAIVGELLGHTNSTHVYCIPFAELESFYASAGFARTDDAPPEVLEKFAWCRRKYEKPVLLMIWSAATPVAALP